MGKTVRDQNGQSRPVVPATSSPARRLPRVMMRAANDNRRSFGSALFAIGLLAAIALVLVIWLSAR